MTTSLCRGMIAITLLCGAADAYADGFDSMHADYDALLQQHVSKGRVDYRALKQNRGVLDSYLRSTASVSMSTFQSWNRDTQLAFLMNVYNAETIQLIINHYPVDSIKDLGTLFTKPWALDTVHLFGKVYTLDDIEHKMIRKNYSEPRIHVALVCAAKGCPNLRSGAYASAELDAQLTEQTLKFLSDIRRNRYDAQSNTLHVSPVFKWYREDFEKNGQSVASFCREYGPPAMTAIPRRSNARIRYTDYDWSLNDIVRKEKR